MENINQKIRTLHETVHRNKKMKRHLSELNKKIKEKTKAVNAYKKQLDKESMDVEKLEKLSIKSVFHKVLGDKEQQIEKEREEYLQAALKYNGSVEEIEKLEFERGVVRKKIDGNIGLADQLKALMKQKETLLKQSNQQIAFKLVGLDRKMLGQNALRNEIIEAIQIGKECLQVLKNIHRDLDLTTQWGRGRGNVYGQGRYSSIQKRSYIDHARKNAFQANRLLERFGEEIKDVYQNIDVQLSVDLKMDSFTGFLDAFFNNLITDWMVQQKIQNAIKGIESVYQVVNEYCHQMDQEILGVDGKIEELRRTKDQLILAG